jgi:hypothetical protein|tara:strand:+ start:51 stop:635 length:585 start_codon:yes stop_codon:yes gene_type:complete
MDSPSLIISICIGIGLSAATGFRVFLPPLVVGLLSRVGFIDLGESWIWLSDDASLLVLVSAALIESFAYFLPWLDNLLDVIMSPMAIVSGIVLSAAFLDGINPGFQWALSIIAGVSLSGGVQASTVFLRGLSTASTAGILNPMFSIAENSISLFLTLTALFFPLIAIVVLVLLLIVIRKIIRKLLDKKRKQVIY